MTEIKNNNENKVEKNPYGTHFVVKGDPVIKQGDHGDTAYLIQSGLVRVYAEHSDKIVELEKLEAGDIFGEMALMTDAPRTATVEALMNSNFIVITRPMMIERLAKTDPLVKALVPMLMKRIKDANNTALNKKETIEDLLKAANSVYQSVESILNPDQKENLERTAKPKLDAFVKAIEKFKKLYDAPAV
ncbi:MAG: cyclic nucleotide-binding protein [Alphaproteobacteria bacterium CG_4_9_14_3_um_filter_47_13]|nr:MAG: cyclic nucleotide-binding protein [Alphaproteobacteria bacterium CG_4_9_14_3_um_filter_47_13]